MKLINRYETHAHYTTKHLHACSSYLHVMNNVSRGIVGGVYALEDTGSSHVLSPLNFLSTNTNNKPNPKNNKMNHNHLRTV